MVPMGVEKCSTAAASVSVTEQEHRIDTLLCKKQKKSVSVNTLSLHHAIDALS